MAKHIVIGDIHRQYNGAINAIQLKQLEHKLIKPSVIALGDLEVGFPNNLPEHVQATSLVQTYDFKFIHGNHDDPDSCKLLPGFLGSYGFLDNIFFMSGAFSIDGVSRTPDVDWYYKEQLTDKQFKEALELYKATKPVIVMTHDCPRACYEIMLLRSFNSLRVPIFENRTANFLDMLLDIHQPRFWLFAHWHRLHAFELLNTQFRCLDVIESRVVDTTAITVA